MLRPGLDAAAAAALLGWPDVAAADLDAYRAISAADGLPPWECGRLAYVAALELERKNARPAVVGPGAQPSKETRDG